LDLSGPLLESLAARPSARLVNLASLKKALEAAQRLEVKIIG
jgi:hypothetical protein